MSKETRVVVGPFDPSPPFFLRSLLLLMNIFTHVFRFVGLESGEEQGPVPNGTSPLCHRRERQGNSIGQCPFFPIYHAYFDQLVLQCNR